MAPERDLGLDLLSDVPLEVGNRPFGQDIFSLESVNVLGCAFFSLVIQGHDYENNND